MTATQAILLVEALPDSPIEASASFHRDVLPQVRRKLEEQGVEALVLVLPRATRDHDDWRRAVVRDLARAFAPKRVNLIAADAGGRREDMLEYLGGAPGITGQYLPAHD